MICTRRIFLFTYVGSSVFPTVGTLAFPPTAVNYTYVCPTWEPYYCWQYEYIMNPAAYVISCLPSLMMLFLLVLLCQVRARIRKKDQIPESCCDGNGPCDDCCCIFCCTPCASCQMMQHVTGGDYELCSETGTPNHAGDLEQGLLPP